MPSHSFARHSGPLLVHYRQADRAQDRSRSKDPAGCSGRSSTGAQKSQFDTPSAILCRVGKFRGFWLHFPADERDSWHTPGGYGRLSRPDAVAKPILNPSAINGLGRPLATTLVGHAAAISAGDEEDAVVRLNVHGRVPGYPRSPSTVAIPSLLVQRGIELGGLGGTLVSLLTLFRLLCIGEPDVWCLSASSKKGNRPPLASSCGA